MTLFACVDTWAHDEKQGPLSCSGCSRGGGGLSLSAVVVVGAGYLDEQQSTSVVLDELTSHEIYADARAPKQPHHGDANKRGNGRYKHGRT